MDAWQRAFGGEDLARDLQNYIRRQAFTATIYKFTGKLASFDAQAAPVPPADLDAYLADFLVQERSLDDAATRLGAVEKRESGNARAKVARASLASDKGDFETAERILRSVGDVDDWFLNYRAGVEFVSAMQGRRATVIPADVAFARKHFDRAKSGGQEFANSLARLASLEVASSAGPTSETRASLERARSIAPGRHDYGLLLAHVLARLREFEAARALLGPLMNTNNPEPIREAARSLMGTVVTIEAEYARRAATPPAAPAPGGSRPAGSSPGNPVSPDRYDPAIRPLYREMKPGEQRLEGLLENIGCVAGKGVTFRIKTPTESVGITSPDLTSVDFITYRSDLKGSVQCGPITPPLNVYVTWRPGTAAGSKIAVAIEFLPK
jgi:thioredoxin-like negative regulator of GroEL